MYTANDQLNVLSKKHTVFLKLPATMDELIKK